MRERQDNEANDKAAINFKQFQCRNMKEILSLHVKQVGKS